MQYAGAARPFQQAVDEGCPGWALTGITLHPDWKAALLVSLAQSVCHCMLSFIPGSVLLLVHLYRSQKITSRSNYQKCKELG